MSRLRRYEIIEHFPSFFPKESFVSTPRTLLHLNPLYNSFPVESDFDFALDLLTPSRFPAECFDVLSPFDEYDFLDGLVEFDTTAFRRSTRIVRRRPDLFLQSLSDRVSALELGVYRLANPCNPRKTGNRKYTLTVEIEDPEKNGFERKYKSVVEITGGKNAEKGAGVERNCKWTAEIKGKGDNSQILRKYSCKMSSADAGETKNKEKEATKNKTEKCVQVVEIEEPSDHGALVLRQAFAKRARAAQKNKGKKKELSPQDAAILIQVCFRSYLIGRSQALRALRELAIAKSKLKEIRSLFKNFTYRRQVARDAEERQKFSERIIVLLLTVDVVEGADITVRAAKKSMVDELEAMLDVIDPQPVKLRRRTFDVPDGVGQNGIAAGVAQIVQMLDQEPNI